MNIDKVLRLSMIKVSNVDSTDFDVDSSVKSTKVTLTVQGEENQFYAFPVIQNM